MGFPQESVKATKKKLGGERNGSEQGPPRPPEKRGKAEKYADALTHGGVNKRSSGPENGLTFQTSRARIREGLEEKRRT